MATNNIEKQSFGQAGATYESGTATITGEFCALLIVEATKFDVLDWRELVDEGVNVNTRLDDGVGSTPYEGHEADRRLAHTTSGTADLIPAGITIYGQIERFKLHSGAVLAYHGA
jgi:hypothetical protein